MSPMNPRLLVPRQEPGILDFAPGAAAAYSLRNLSLSYNGPVVTVRRSTDDAEADFTAAEVSDGTLAAWCSGGDGFVKQWWDQSGNARHATASGTAQPQIVDSGVVITEGGKAAVQFDGTDDNLLTSVTVSPPYSLFAVVKETQRHIGPFLGPTTRTNLGFGDVKSGATDYNNGKWAPWGSGRAVYGNNIAVVTQNQTVVSAFVVGTSLPGDCTVFADGAGGVVTVQYAGTAPGTTIDNAKIGRRSTDAEYWDGTISELIIYPTDQTALRTRIEGNLAWTYNA